MLGFQIKLKKMLDNIIKEISKINFETSSHLFVEKKIVFSDSDFYSKITQVAYSEVKAGVIINPHSHISMEEIFLVLDGSLEIVIDQQKYIVNKEYVFKVPVNSIHQIKALTNSRLFYFGVAI